MLQRGVTYVVDGLVVEVLGGDDLLNDLLLDLLAEVLERNVGSVLGGDDNGVDAERDDRAVVVCVLNGDLGLGVGPEPRDGAVVAGVGHGLVKLVGELDGEGEVLGGLVGGISEHDTLVTGTELLESLIVVKTLGNVGALLLNGNEDVAGLVVEALVGRVVANVLDGIADNLLVVKVGLGGDLAEDHDHTGLGGGLTGNLGEGVLPQAGIEDGVRDLIAAGRVSKVGKVGDRRVKRHVSRVRVSELRLAKLMSEGFWESYAEHTRSCRGVPRRLIHL